MRDSGQGEPADDPLWRYVSPGEYRVPSSPVEQTVRTGLGRLWGRLRPVVAASDDRFEVEGDFEAISEEQLSRLAPAPGWDGACAALDQALASWASRTTGDPVAVLVIGHPHAGSADILRRWGAERAWRLPRLPEPGEIFDGRLEWLDELAGDGSPWVLPSLERCFLRHVHGLTLVRQLLTRVSAGRLGRGVIGCDSWGWAYLRHLWAGQPPPTLVAQAFDCGRLARWLGGPVEAGPPITVFRQPDNGRYVWQPADAAFGEVPTSDFLRFLAAESRGIPGVASAWWRRSLLGTARQLGATKATLDTPAGVRTVLVRPWNQLKGLKAPGNSARETGLVLHALLLHNGLSLDMLPRVLPLSSDKIVHVLSRLEAAELVARDGAYRYEVTALGYPAARAVVAGLGYMKD